MILTALVACLMLSADEGSAAPRRLERRLHELNLEDARQWDMWLDQSRQAKAELIERPVYLWTNPTKGQYGSVFVWVHEGRPIVVGSIFAHPIGKQRRMTHEFHALSADRIYPDCRDDDSSAWEPTTGIALTALKGGPVADKSPSRRLLQMRTIARQFSGHTIDWRKQRWELRLLPQPLYRYQKPSGDVIDGALLALVTDAGTDPEVLLLLEAHSDGAWKYATLRFSDSSLYVHHEGKEVLAYVRGQDSPPTENAERTYQVFKKRILDEPIVPEDKDQP